MTTRRALLRSLATGALIAGTWPATAQQPPKIPRVGVLWFGSKNDLLFSRWSGVFRQRLSELGYKKAKKLSEALAIMGAMKRGHHVDPDLFDLFLASGVFRRYAERFLQPEQIDDVDIGPFLGPVPAHVAGG